MRENQSRLSSRMSRTICSSRKSVESPSHSWTNWSLSSYWTYGTHCSWALSYIRSTNGNFCGLCLSPRHLTAPTNLTSKRCHPSQSLSRKKRKSCSRTLLAVRSSPPSMESVTWNVDYSVKRNQRSLWLKSMMSWPKIMWLSLIKS